MGACLVTACARLRTRFNNASLKKERAHTYSSVDFEAAAAPGDDAAILGEAEIRCNGSSGSVLIMHKETVVLHECLGFERRTVPTTKRTRYRMFSLGHPIIAVLCMLLQDRTRFNIHAALQDVEETEGSRTSHVPWTRIVRLLPPGTSIYRLMSEPKLIPDVLYEMYYREQRPSQTIVDLTVIADLLEARLRPKNESKDNEAAQSPPLFLSGVLLTDRAPAVIHNITAFEIVWHAILHFQYVSPASLIREHIFKPLNMSESAFGFDALENEHVHDHHIAQSQWQHAYIAISQTLTCTLHDYAQFHFKYRMLLDNLSGILQGLPWYNAEHRRVVLTGESDWGSGTAGVARAQCIVLGADTIAVACENAVAEFDSTPLLGPVDKFETSVVGGIVKKLNP